MKERPILFNAENVKAILEGRKTQTRRVSGLEDVNNYPGTLEYKGLMPGEYYLVKRSHKDFFKHPNHYHWFLGTQPGELNPIPVKCPHGQVGDRLWVEQTWRVSDVTSPMSKGIVTIEFKAGNPNVQLTNNEFVYNAQGIYLPVTYTAIKTRKWQSALFMPKSVASIWREITEVRVERVQEISEKDIYAEGAGHSGMILAQTTMLVTGTDNLADAQKVLSYSTFKQIWDSLNAKRGYAWETNPWCWVISFKVTK